MLPCAAPSWKQRFHPGTDASDKAVCPGSAADPCSELSTLLAPGVNHSRCEAHGLEMAPRNLAIGLVTTSWCKGTGSSSHPKLFEHPLDWSQRCVDPLLNHTYPWILIKTKPPLIFFHHSSMLEEFRSTEKTHRSLAVDIHVSSIGKSIYYLTTLISKLLTGTNRYNFHPIRVLVCC